MSSLELTKIYPSALALARGKALSHTAYKRIFKKAVEELGFVNPTRMKHVLAVATTLESISRQNPRFLLDKIPEKTKLDEIQNLQLNPDQYHERYVKELRQIFSVYNGLSKETRKVLDLAAWAHDLGIPFGIEWEHNIHGARVVREMIRDAHLQESIALLVHHHGEYSNLTSSTFPRDIYRLPAHLIPALFILDFCDAVARVGKDGTHSNPIGLKAMEFYLKVSTVAGLSQLEKAEEMFALRNRYGFGPIVFNRSLSAQTIDAMFKHLPFSMNFHDLIEFYGSKFRCQFLDILLNAVETDEERGSILAAIFQSYSESQMTGEVTLAPDLDLGRVLQEDKKDFQQRFGAHFKRQGLKGLLKADRRSENIWFMATKLYPEKRNSPCQ